MSHQKRVPGVAPVQDRLSYLWLALAVVLLPLGAGRWTVPLAAWLYPIFLLRFVRTQPLVRGMLVATLGAAAGVGVMWAGGFLPMPPVLFVPLVIIIAVIYILPYLADRVLAHRLTRLAPASRGLLASLVFPLAMTSVWYLWSVLAPWGTQYNPAYSQYGNLPLLQLLSVTGLWGINFLMAWLASLVNWAWEQDYAWPRVRGGVALYGGILALVLLFGSVRLAFVPARGGMVRVAGISPSHAATDAFNGMMTQFAEGGSVQALLTGTTTPEQRATIHQATVALFAEMLGRTEQEARGGAKIIVWPECSGGVFIMQEDEAPLLAQASALARSTGAYLNLGLCVVMSQGVQHGRPSLDKSILIDPSGEVVWDYRKAHPIFMAENDQVPGDGTVPAVQTPFGRVASVICNDDLFAGTLRRAAQARADVMLEPANDYREITPYHAQQAVFRAIEDGFSLVRQTSKGLAVTADYQGHVLAATDYFASDPQTMVGYVPVQGVRTIYAAIGDAFAWLCVAGLVVLIILVLAIRPSS